MREKEWRKLLALGRWRRRRCRHSNICVPTDHLFAVRGVRSGGLSGVGGEFGDDPCQGPVLRLQPLILGLQLLQLLRKGIKHKRARARTARQGENNGRSCKKRNM